LTFTFTVTYRADVTIKMMPDMPDDLTEWQQRRVGGHRSFQPTDRPRL
jgi:hypothetical protein